LKISLVTDEVSADLETAIELGLEWGVDAFELRGIGDRRVPNFSDYQKQRVLELIETYGISIAAISPGLFKIPYPPKKRKQFSLQVFDSNCYEQWQAARHLLDYHIKELLPASIEYAKQVGARQIIAFSFERGDQPPGLPPDEILEIFKLSARQVAQAGLRLSIEVEDHFWADTGGRTAAIIRAVGEAGFGVNWDPGNAFEAGDIPYPDGYQAVRGHVQHVHFKDVVRRSDGTCYYACEGDIDWAGQIRALHEDHYQGFISVEPHMQPKVSAARAATARLKKLVQMIEKPPAD
jgi:sugar phosphate isomerase/epimerase